MSKLVSMNPATEQVLAEFNEITLKSAFEQLGKLHEGQLAWEKSNVEERAKAAGEIAKVLRAHKRDCARLITAEMGKPIKAAEAEVEKCAWMCDYLMREGPGFLRNDNVVTENSKSYVRYDPLGIVLAIMPWNFPFWQLFRVAVPAMIAGNAVALKHASNVPQCALKIEEVFKEAGLEEVFKTLLVGSDGVPGLIESEHIDGVSLTGSSWAGSRVGEIAGKNIKKAVLELGGSDPFIVLQDCDVDKAAQAAVNARMQNSGQSCIAAKRFIVHTDVYDFFKETIGLRLEKMAVGDPMNDVTQIGPLATEKILKEVTVQVQKSVKGGATLICGGKRMAGKGFFYEPTILENVKEGTPAYSEEIFGPVMSIIRVTSEQEAIDVANDTEYGLGASLWTADILNAERIAARLKAGQVFVNKAVASDPRLPFGGIKKSGFGRELGKWGMREFTNIKTVVVS